MKESRILSELIITRNAICYILVFLLEIIYQEIY